MDRVIAKKKWTSKRIITIAGIVAIAILISASYYFTSGKSRLNVDTERITISEVSKGPFQVTIPINGIVLPQTSIYLDAQEGGRVEQRFVEDGAVMQEGAYYTAEQPRPGTKPCQPGNQCVQCIDANADRTQQRPAKHNMGDRHNPGEGYDPFSGPFLFSDYSIHCIIF